MRNSLAVILCVICIVCVVGGCTQDAYEKGEGEYSLMRGDFAEAFVGSDKKVASVTTDDGDRLPLAIPFSASWITKADTTYRCMLYYNKVKGTDGAYQAEVVSMSSVPCPVLKSRSETNPVKTDPVKFESLWLSKIGKYVNLRLLLKTGMTDDSTAVQRLALVSDTVLAYADGTRSRHLRLHHDQNRVPEYYSTQVYISIPTDSIAADTVSFSINTYDGLVVKTLTLR